MSRDRSFMCQKKSRYVEGRFSHGPCPWGQKIEHGLYVGAPSALFVPLLHPVHPYPFSFDFFSVPVPFVRIALKLHAARLAT